MIIFIISWILLGALASVLDFFYHYNKDLTVSQLGSYILLSLLGYVAFLVLLGIFFDKHKNYVIFKRKK